MSELRRVGPAMYEVPRTEGMRVPGLVIASPEQLSRIRDDKSLDQVRNVAHLPGIVGYSLAMPDIHWGYGFPIGGVAAMEIETGVISPGGVGYDINCGVRLAMVPLKGISAQWGEKLIQSIYDHVPSGVGRGHRGRKSLDESDYKNIARKGVRWSLEHGFGVEEDIAHVESQGILEDADSSMVSHLAKSRGKDQLGTIGSGNHFVEIGVVAEIFDTTVAEAWGMEQGQVYILIHTGSRGFGHQVCQDTLNQFMKKGYARGLPDKQLVAAPIRSADGQQYFHAMATAAHFAFNNRQQVLHYIREAFRTIVGIRPHEIRLIYDVCHNIAKFETHMVDGKEMRLCVHRKGATRAFGAGAPELAPAYRATGQPVIVPGDMGRASYVMVGEGNPISFCSACHGAGRAMSRHQSLHAWQNRDPFAAMREQDVIVVATSRRTILEEMPDAYKDVSEVVDATEMARLARKVVRLKPHLVLKG